VHVALDAYFHAYRISSSDASADLETEAIALSRIAHLFNVVLKMPVKSRTFARKSLEAAASCHPRTFHDKDWYKTAAEIVKQAQDDDRKFDEQAGQKEKQPFLDALKDDLAMLDTMANDSEKDSWKVLILHVYKKFPPPNGKTMHGSAEDMTKNTKKVIMSALQDYHPDKLKDKADMKTYVLMEEITKRLTRVYETVVKSMNSSPAEAETSAKSEQSE
jgi:hypothetical protein